MLNILLVMRTVLFEDDILAADKRLSEMLALGWADATNMHGCPDSL